MSKNPFGDIDDISVNTSGNPSLDQVSQTRRQVLIKGGLGLLAGPLFISGGELR